MISRSSRNSKTDIQEHDVSKDVDDIIRMHRLESAMEDEGMAVWQL